MTPKFNTQKLVDPAQTTFSPTQAMTLAVNSVQERSIAHGGFITRVPGLDSVMLPMRPGELIGVIGYTSNFKSGLMSYIARQVMHQLPDPEKEVVIYVSWEQTVEEQTLLDLAFTAQVNTTRMYRAELMPEDMQRLMEASVSRAGLPYWLIGHSESSNTRRPRLSMTDVANALAYTVDVHQKKPAFLVLDYLQRINRDDCHAFEARLAFMEIIDRAKDMALAFHCPVLLGTQAGRHLLERKWKQPQLADSQESSTMEQTCDKVLSTWLPKTSENIGSIIGGKHNPFTVTENLLLINLLKQKYGPAPALLAVNIHPETNSLNSILDDEGEVSIPYSD
jgi:replicative DNA helicase